MTTAQHAALSVSESDHRLKHAIFSGAIAGQIAGLVMAAVIMLVFTVFLGKGPLFPVQVIGSFIFGDVALQGFYLPAFVAGLLLHQLGPALAWGIVFGVAAMFLRTDRGLNRVLLALGIGLASQVIDVNLVLSNAFFALHGHDIWAENVPAFWSWAAHAVFGLALLIYPRPS